LGTRLYFALHITAAGDAPFSLSQVSYSETDPPDVYPTETYGFDYSGSSYASDLIGRTGATWGTFINSGAGTQMVSELIYVGEAIGWEPNPYTGSNQADLNGVRDYLAGFAGQYITGTYFATGAPSISGRADVQFESGGVPEPGTIALAAMGLAAMLFVRRKYS
jgi:hypothetical protein